MPEKTLNELFMDELKDAYDFEHRITKALPKLIKVVESDELRTALESHLRETEEQIQRLEQVFEMFDEEPAKKTCKGMMGLLTEGDEMVQEMEAGVLRDAAVIAACQKVEHYELATYGCLRTWASLLGDKKAAGLLQKSLDEEGAADHKLTEIADELNIEALDEDAAEEETVTVGRRSNGARSAPKSRKR